MIYAVYVMLVSSEDEMSYGVTMSVAEDEAERFLECILFSNESVWIVPGTFEAMS